MELLITRYMRLKDYRVWLNGSVEYVSGREPFAQFIRSVYRHCEIDYPKFFKMDNLCKLAFLSAEILLRGTGIPRNYPAEQVAILLENASSSLEFDLKHIESIRDRNNYFPSPSVFVYTIPNIMVAEIAIRHKVNGENAVFIFDEFDPGFIYDYASELFRNQQVNCCLTGWVECYGERYESFLFTIEQEDRIKTSEKSQEYIVLNKSNVEKLYKGNRDD